MSNGSPCRKTGCEVATTGRCALGNDPVESCDEYGVEEAQLDHGEDAEEAEAAERPVEPKRRLHRSALLSREELWAIRKAVPTTTISLIGDNKAGKTTLIAALYGSFCKGPFAGYKFRSSRTLTAFAERHHQALDRSARSLPTTPRTSRQDGVGFFHLNVVGAAGQRHLMIADRSGEDFKESRRNTELIGKLWELEMADRICFILDAGKLARPETRAGYKRRFKQQIWALLNNDALPEHTALEVISTKLDKLAPKPATEPDLCELEEFENAVVEEFAEEGRRLDVRRICALPRSNFAVGLIGLESLLQGWLPNRPVSDCRPLTAVAPARWVDRMLTD